MGISSGDKPREGDSPEAYDILDFIVIVAEHWLILLLLPILLAVGTFFVATMVGRPWQATVVVPISTAFDASEVATFIDEVTAKHPDVSVIEVQQTLSLQAVAPTEDDAAARVKAAAVALINLQREAFDVSLDTLSGRLEKLNSLVKEPPGSILIEDAAMLYSLAYAAAGVTSRIDDLTMEGERYSRDRALLDRPIVADVQHLGRSAIILSVSTGAFSFIVIATLLCARAAWRNLAENPRNAVRINRVRSAFFWGPKTRP